MRNEEKVKLDKTFMVNEQELRSTFTSQSNPVKFIVTFQPTTQRDDVINVLREHINREWVSDILINGDMVSLTPARIHFQGFLPVFDCATKPANMTQLVVGITVRLFCNLYNGYVRVVCAGMRIEPNESQLEE
jgi:hypothetical protein